MLIEGVCVRRSVVVISLRTGSFFVVPVDINVLVAVDDKVLQVVLFDRIKRYNKRSKEFIEKD